MRFSDIIEDVNFRAICVPIRVAMYARGPWLARRQAIPFWTLWKTLEHATKNYSAQMETYVPTLTAMLHNIAKAMPALQVSNEVIAGYLRLIDSHGAIVPPVMLAYASAPDRFTTPAQVAEVAHTSESLWRNRAAANEIPGAIKAGKQWLLPRDVLRLMYGIEMPDSIFTPTPDKEETARNAVAEPPLTEAEFDAARRQLNADLN